MISHLRMIRTIWFITAVSAMTAALVGIFDPSIYDGLVTRRIIPGVFTQDLLVFDGAVILLLLSMTLRNNRPRSIIAATGIMGFFFYAFGIYAIEQIYTHFYPLYLFVLGISFFGMIHTLSHVNFTKVDSLRLPAIVRYICAGYAIFVALMFTAIWVGQLMPLIRQGYRIEYTFSVYIIDLAFIMPALAICGIMSFRGLPLGTIGVPALFILGAGILSPLALAELIKPRRYGLPTNWGELWLYLILSLVFLVLIGVYFVFLKQPEHE